MIRSLIVWLQEKVEKSWSGLKKAVNFIKKYNKVGEKTLRLRGKLNLRSHVLSQVAGKVG